MPQVVMGEKEVEKGGKSLLDTERMFGYIISTNNRRII
jgi:hypothetical protein